MEKYLLLIPVFNDWKSLNILFEQIDSELSIFEHEFSVVIVNDCSTNKLNIENQKFSRQQNKFFEMSKIQGVVFVFGGRGRGLSGFVKQLNNYVFNLYFVFCV